MLYTNIIHRADPSEDRLEALDFQWEAARALGMASTTLLTWRALRDPQALDHVCSMWQGSHDELGLHFHEFSCPEFAREYHSREKAFWLLPRAVRTSMIDDMMSRYHRCLGAYPRAVGGYILDAWTLRYIKKHYPSVTTAITNCFEEGVKMFQGNNYGWHLFSDGGPWGPFRPSRANALIPAQNESDALDIVALPHLNRDMILALTSRDDLFASHPLNLVRAKINQGAHSPYLYRFYDQWLDQATYNNWSYLSYFISAPWVSLQNDRWGDPHEGRELYINSLKHLAQATQTGAVSTVTMSEFGDIYRSKSKPGAATLCNWHEVLNQSKRQMVWAVNSHYRAAVDLNVGASLCDFRVYCGRLSKNLGPDPDCDELWNGNYPYVISAEHRGSIYNSGWICSVAVGKHSASLASRRLSGTVETITPGKEWKLVCEGAKLTLGDTDVCIVSTFWFNESSAIRVERALASVSDPNAKVILTETLSGGWGTTEYPESLLGARLWIENEAERTSLDFKYLSGEISTESARKAGVDLPHIGSTLELSTGELAHATLQDGTAFSPFYHIALSHPLTLKTPVITCLNVKPLHDQ